MVAALATAGATVVEVATHHVGRAHIYRDVTISVHSKGDADSLVDVLRLLPNMSVERVVDEVLRIHEGGKMLHRGRLEIHTFGQMREVYTPGVAKVCRAIQDDPALARRYTNAGNTVAVVSNGSRVLGF